MPQRPGRRGLAGPSERLTLADQTPTTQLQQIRSVKATKGATVTINQISYESNEITHVEAIPYSQNLYFTNRRSREKNAVNILNEIRVNFFTERSGQSSHIQALSGIGGVGKTQIALAYAYKFRKEYTAVLWVSAGSEQSLIDNYAALCRPLNISNTPLDGRNAKSINKNINKVRQWLSSHQGWLLILDNADQPKLLKPFLPLVVGGHILVTTRAPTLHEIGVPRPIIVTQLAPEESLALLKNRTGRRNLSPAEKKSAAELATILKHLPVALEAACANIIMGNLSFAEFLKRYRAHRLDLLKSPISDDYRYSIDTVWSMNISEIEKSPLASKEVFTLCCFLAGDRIPIEFILGSTSHKDSHLGKYLRSSGADPAFIQDVLAPLERFSLLSRDIDERTLSIHSMVQEVAKSRMEPSEHRYWAERVLRLVDIAFRESELSGKPLTLGVLPQLDIASAFVGEWKFTSAEAGRVQNQAGLFRAVQGEYHQALALLLEAHTLLTHTAPESTDLVACFNNLAIAYKSDGQYAQALTCYESALTLQERLSGHEHPNVATILDNLGELYSRQDKADQAESLYIDALRIREKLLPFGHLDRAISLGNLGSLQLLRKDYDAARRLFAHALGSLQGTEEEEGLLAGTIRYNMAAAAYICGNYPVAKRLCETALRLRERELRPDHPDVAQCRRSLQVIDSALQLSYDASLEFVSGPREESEATP